MNNKNSELKLREITKGDDGVDVIRYEDEDGIDRYSLSSAGYTAQDISNKS